MPPFLRAVAEDLHHRFGDQIHQTAIVFNNKRPILFLKRYLAQVYGKTFIAPAMFTVQEFMSLSTNKAVAHDLSRFFILWHTYNQLLQKEGQEKVDPEEFYSLSQTILSDFDQIEYELVNPQELYTNLKERGSIDREFSNFTPEQQAFLSNFWSSFSEEKQADVQQKFIELWARLPRLFTLFHKKMAQQNLTGIASLYRALARGEAVIPEFINKYKKVAFVGFNALTKCEEVLFKKWQEEEKALFYFDADAYYIDDNFQEAGKFLRKNLRFLKNALGKPKHYINQADKALNIYATNGSSAQAKALNQHLKEKKEDTNPNKIAILLADENLIIPTLQSIPDERKINITMGFPLRESSVFHFINQWIDLKEQLQDKDYLTFTEEDLQAFLNMGLFSLSKELQDHILEQKRRLSGKAFYTFLLQSDKILQLLFSKQTNGITCIENLKQLLIEILHQQEEEGKLQQLNGELLLKVYREMNRLQDQLEVYQKHLTFPLIIQLIRRNLSHLSVPLEGEPLAGIQIMGMLESRCLDFEEVYILGANEGTLPFTGVANTFIPESLRHAFGLPLQEDREALSAYIFYRLCQRAKNINIFYNNLTGYDSTGEVSRFVQQLNFESQLEKKDLFHQKNSLTVLPLQQKIRIAKNQSVIEKLKEYIGENHKKAFSPSALRKYLDCPLQFFLQYIAGIKEPTEPFDPFKPSEMGDLLHKVMEKFYFSFKGKEITKKEITKKEEELPALCAQVMKGKFKEDHTEELISNSQKTIIKEVLIENVHIILNRDKKLAPFTILALEKDISTAINLSLPGFDQPKKVFFNGYIDRIDKVKGKIRIVDYKTGGDEVEFKGEGVSALFSSNSKQANPAAMQILLYALLYYKLEGQIPETHLYVLRRMQEEENTRIRKKKNKKETFPAIDSKEFMALYKEGLEEFIGTIFDSDIPFEHNSDSKYCKNKPYHIFCDAGEEAVPEEE